MALLPIFPASASFIINHYKSHLEREYPFDIISGLYPPTRTKVSQVLFIGSNEFGMRMVVLFIGLIYFKTLTYRIHLDAERFFEICCLLTKAISANSDPGWCFMRLSLKWKGWTWTIPSDWSSNTRERTIVELNLFLINNCLEVWELARKTSLSSDTFREEEKIHFQTFICILFYSVSF